MASAAITVDTSAITVVGASPKQSITTESFVSSAVSDNVGDSRYAYLYLRTGSQAGAHGRWIGSILDDGDSETDSVAYPLPGYNTAYSFQLQIQADGATAEGLITESANLLYWWLRATNHSTGKLVMEYSGYNCQSLLLQYLNFTTGRRADAWQCVIEGGGRCVVTIPFSLVDTP